MLTLGTRLPALVTAHQGGWDEFLWVAAPIVVMFGLLRLAGTRARAIERERGTVSRADAGAPGETGPTVSRSD